MKRLLAFLDHLRVERRTVATRESAETRNLIDVAAAMAVCALFREESRGAHFRTDFPQADDARFLGHTRLDARGPRLADVDVPLPAVSPC